MADLIDERMHRALDIRTSPEKGDTIHIIPGVTMMSYASDFYESPGATFTHATETLEMLDPKSKEYNSLKTFAERRIDTLNKHREEEKNNYVSGLSFIHPYALLRLNGVTGHDAGNSGSSTLNVIDNATSRNNRKWYETGLDKIPDGASSQSYAKNPTTGDLINWSASDPMGRFPYMFQDFVFCKNWNKIENNRMITLRRYPAPVVDAVEPADYGSVTMEKSMSDSAASSETTPRKRVMFAPLATLITYFGESTGNSIKELLSFSYHYNWKELETDVWNTSSNQIEEGNILGSGGPLWLAGGLGTLAKATGILKDLQGVSQIQSKHALGLPPDPYSSGPYENRIFGPVNVIKNTFRRERGLTFKHDSITISFEYMARPIAHVNNKAIMLDLLANALAMTYSSGTFFGGAHRYRCEKPSIYPWRNTNSLNKIYQGKIFGKDGAWWDVLGDVFNKDNANWIMNFAKGITDAVKAVATDLINAVTGKSPSPSEKEENEKSTARGKMLVDNVFGTAGRAVAAKFLKGSQAPWLQDARALLTGEPIGDWHLTIGNPLNPIAMIGNLIVTDSKIEFSDELGPDDFPIGFKVSITLQHGMGRDKDAIESMFNRGTGRIYILPDDFVSSADGETTVDMNSGENNPLAGKFKANGEYGILRTTGSYDVKGQTSAVVNSQDRAAILGKYSTTLNTTAYGSVNVINKFSTQAWAMHKIL